MASIAFLSSDCWWLLMLVRYIYDLRHRDHVSERVMEVLGFSLPNYLKVRYLKFVHRVLVFFFFFFLF